MTLSEKINKSIELIQSPRTDMVSKKSISFKLLDSIAVDSASLMPADVAKIILLLDHPEPSVITSALCCLICISQKRPDLNGHMMADAFPRAVLKLQCADNPCIEGALDFLMQLSHCDSLVAESLTRCIASDLLIQRTFETIISHGVEMSLLAKKILMLNAVLARNHASILSQKILSFKEESPINRFRTICADLRSHIGRNIFDNSLFAFIRFIVEAKALPGWSTEVSSMTPELIKLFENRKMNEDINTDFMVHTLWLLRHALHADSANLSLIIKIQPMLESLLENKALLPIVTKQVGLLLRDINKENSRGAATAEVAVVFADAEPQSGGAASGAALK